MHDFENSHKLEHKLPTFIFQVTICPNFKFDKRQVNLSELFRSYKSFKTPQDEELYDLEIASVLCDENIPVRLNHAPVNMDMDITRYHVEDLFFIRFFWRNGLDFSYHPLILTEEGQCSTYNAINAQLIFRNETVDSDFLERYRNEHDFKLNPQFWSIEEGYTAGRIKTYPRRTFDIGKENGLKIILKLRENLVQYIDTHCRNNYNSFRISLHHPAEVTSKIYYEVAMNKSASIIIKPKITKTTESLKSYEPSV